MSGPVVIGIAPDVVELEPGKVRLVVPTRYTRSVRVAGGLPVILDPDVELIESQLAMCAGFVFIGGDDPRTEPFGEPTDSRVTPVHAMRQGYEMSLLVALGRSPLHRVLGVCLGMQMMALSAGGKLNQWMPDTIESAGAHWDDRVHAIVGASGCDFSGAVTSHHRQAVSDAGRLRVVATAPDGVIEAIDDPARAMFLGVQWHPERTDDEVLGAGVFRRLVGEG